MTTKSTARTAATRATRTPDATAGTAPAISHTPTPWTVEPGDGGDASVGLGPQPTTIFASVPNDDRFRVVEIAVIKEAIYGNDEEGHPLYWGDADANADFIVKAVNAHRELVLALEAADAAINPPDRGGISLHAWNERLKITTRVIRDVLARVR